MDVESNTVKILNLRAAVAAQFIRASSIPGDLLTLLGKATERESSWRSEGAGRAGVPAAPKARAGGLRNVAVAVIPIAVVLITFLFWYSTWFGRPLPDREMARYLADTSVPHRTQHALAQAAAQIARGDPSARRWYPQVIRLASGKEPQLRLMAAWVMGQDNRSQEFHKALLALAADPEQMVRGNAALALVRFGDASGEDQLKLLLRPYMLVASQAGSLTFRLKEHDAVRSGSIVARIRDGDAPAVEVRSPLAGELGRCVAADGSRVAAGAEIAVLLPGQEQVWEALRALSLVGRPEDLEDVDRCSSGASGMPERVRQQAAITAEAIRKRQGQ